MSDIEIYKPPQDLLPRKGGESRRNNESSYAPVKPEQTRPPRAQYCPETGVLRSSNLPTTQAAQPTTTTTYGSSYGNPSSYDSYGNYDQPKTTHTHSHNRDQRDSRDNKRGDGHKHGNIFFREEKETIQQTTQQTTVSYVPTASHEHKHDYNRNTNRDTNLDYNRDYNRDSRNRGDGKKHGNIFFREDEPKGQQSTSSYVPPVSSDSYSKPPENIEIYQPKEDLLRRSGKRGNYQPSSQQPQMDLVKTEYYPQTNTLRSAARPKATSYAPATSTHNHNHSKTSTHNHNHTTTQKTTLRSGRPNVTSTARRCEYNAQSGILKKIETSEPQPTTTYRSNSASRAVSNYQSTSNYRSRPAAPSYQPSSNYRSNSSSRAQSNYRPPAAPTSYSHDHSSANENPDKPYWASDFHKKIYEDEQTKTDKRRSSVVYYS